MKNRRVTRILLMLVALLSAVVVLAQARSDTYPFSIGANYGDRSEYAFEVTTTGTIRAEVQWSGHVPLALILRGPGQIGYYDRRDGFSPLAVSYQVTQEMLARGTSWQVSVINSSRTVPAFGNVTIDYPTPVFGGPWGPGGPGVPSNPGGPWGPPGNPGGPWGPPGGQGNPFDPGHNAQRFDGFDRLSLSSVELRGNKATITVDYTLLQHHAQAVYLDGQIMNNGTNQSQFVCTPVRVFQGSNRAVLEVTYAYHNPPRATTTDQIRIGLREGSNEYYCAQTYKLNLTWRR